jgi:hypothetical protein
MPQETHSIPEWIELLVKDMRTVDDKVDEIVAWVHRLEKRLEELEQPRVGLVMRERILNSNVPVRLIDLLPPMEGIKTVPQPHVTQELVGVFWEGPG